MGGFGDGTSVMELRVSRTGDLACREQMIPIVTSRLVFYSVGDFVRLLLERFTRGFRWLMVFWWMASECQHCLDAHSGLGRLASTRRLSHGGTVVLADKSWQVVKNSTVVLPFPHVTLLASSIV